MVQLASKAAPKIFASMLILINMISWVEMLNSVTGKLMSLITLTPRHVSYYTTHRTIPCSQKLFERIPLWNFSKLITELFAKALKAEKDSSVFSDFVKTYYGPRAYAADEDCQNIDAELPFYEQDLETVTNALDEERHQYLQGAYRIDSKARILGVILLGSHNLHNRAWVNACKCGIAVALVPVPKTYDGLSPLGSI